MGDYGLKTAQLQYDNAEPPRYNRKWICNCYYCDSEIYIGERCAVIYGTYICCMDCFSLDVAEGDEQ